MRQAGSGILRLALAGALVAVGMLLLPTAALGADFTVNRTTNESDALAGDSICDINTGTPAHECTLRAALEQSNTNGGGVVDSIGFDTAAMGGSTITVPVSTAGLPSISTPVGVNGCSGTLDSRDPCVGLRSDTSLTGTGLNFNTGADLGSSVRGLAFTNWSVALRYANLDATTGPVEVQNNWFGSALGGANEANSFGIALQGSASTIGGDENGVGLSERNVFSNNSGTAIQISGGDSNAIQGNYFGTSTDGSGVATGAGSTGNGEAIEVVESTTAVPSPDRPEGTLIGDTAPVTSECDGACNLIATSTASSFAWTIDLWGESATSEEPAGSTTIAGNFIGLNKAGNGPLGTNAAAIQVRAGDADQVTIGGDAAGDANYITGGNYGIHGQGDDLVVDGNFVGTNAAGNAEVAPPASSGVTAFSVAAEPATVTDNVVGYNSAYGVELSGQGGEASANSIGVGAGDSDIGGGSGALRLLGRGWDVDSNVLGNATITGIELQQGDDNVITGNHIGETPAGASAPVGQAGIRIIGFAGIGDFANGNVIGGDTAAEENVISNTDPTFGDGIRIADDDPDADGGNNVGNEILRNRGGGHGQFIDLANDGLGNPDSGPNGGIEVPTVTTANTLTISGSAKPGAVVRVFQTTAVDGTVPKDIASYVGKATADGTGEWTLRCPSADCAASAAENDRITASQTTSADGTSELSNAETVVLPPDTDSDGVFDPSDNCPTAPNPGQVNHDGDGQGDACDADDDNDGKADGSDACPAGAASGTDTDGDGCFDPEDTDDDNDGFADGSDDCQTTVGTAGGCPDEDGDGVRNGVDNCPSIGNPGQADTDQDGLGDACDQGQQPPVRDSDPPETTVRKAKVKGDDVKVVFRSDEPGSTFQCRLDKKKLKPCTSPKRLKNLHEGKHRVFVQATDAAGNVDPTAAKKKFEIED
jgi:hypothetical protein